MTTLDLAQRLLRSMPTPDLSRMASDEALALLDAANGGLQKLYGLVPAVYRRSAITAVLQAPRTVTVGVEKYSVTLTSGSFAASERGCTVAIAGDVSHNEVVGETQLVAKYLGETGTREAVVYGDKISLYGTIVHISSAPRLHTGEVLTQVDVVAGARWACDSMSRISVGRPRHYYLAPVGVSRGGDPMALLRVHPLPDVDYRVEMECEFHPTRLTFMAISEPVTLPIQDAVLESILLPLCEWELAGTRYFTGDKQQAAMRRDEAMLHASRIRAGLLPSQNRVRTRQGY